MGLAVGMLVVDAVSMIVVGLIDGLLLVVEEVGRYVDGLCVVGFADGMVVVGFTVGLLVVGKLDGFDDVGLEVGLRVVLLAGVGLG